MKNIRKYSGNIYTLLFMSLAFLFTSCGGEDIVPDTDITSQQMRVTNPNSYSGEDLFRSLVFYDGPISKEIYGVNQVSLELAKMDAVKKSDFNKMKTDIIADINKKDSKFMDNFKIAMLSGDPLVIKAKLAESQNKVYDALENVLMNDNISLNDLVSEYNGINGAYPELPGDIGIRPQGLALILLITIVIVIGIAINITVTKTKVEDVLSGPTTSTARLHLDQEMMIIDIANQLKYN
jgi:hypothetical protein